MTLDIDCFGFLFHFIVVGIRRVFKALLMEAQYFVSTTVSLRTGSEAVTILNTALWFSLFFFFDCT